MDDTVQLITAFAIGALLVSVGVLVLVMKVGNAIESMAKGGD